MKVAIAICLFAFVGIQLGPVTADIPIDDMADWDCVADGLQLAAEKYPQFAHLYEQLDDFYQTFAIEARKCNDTNDWVRQLYCQCEWKDLVEKMNKEFYDLVKGELDEAGIKEFLRTIDEHLRKCMHGMNPRFAGRMQGMSPLLKFF